MKEFIENIKEQIKMSIFVLSIFATVVSFYFFNVLTTGATIMVQILATAVLLVIVVFCSYIISECIR